MGEILYLFPNLKPKKLNCCMSDCQAEVTHLDVKGFIYCADHGKQRKGTVRSRKLKPNELTKLNAGQQLEKY